MLSKRVVFSCHTRYLNGSYRVKLVILTGDLITTWFVNGSYCVGLTGHIRNWHACLDLTNNISSVIRFLIGDPIMTRHVNGLLDNDPTKPIIFMSFRVELMGHVRNCQPKQSNSYIWLQSSNKISTRQFGGSSNHKQELEEETLRWDKRWAASLAWRLT